MHPPLIAFLFVLGFRPAVDLFRRYRHNWTAKQRPFTIAEGALLFILGAIGTALLNGSLSHSPSEYSHAAASAFLLWGAASAVFLALTVTCSFLQTKVAVTKPIRDDLMDVPITDDAEDLLGRVKFVDDLYAQIRDFPSEDSLAFGLNGSWGTGKTSVLNLLRNRLQRDKKMIVVDFNPWYFQSPETITRRFYDGVARAMNQEFFYPDLTSVARRYAGILAPVLKRYGIDYQKPDEGTVEEVKTLVESYIVVSGRRVVVIIDDLERAHRDELLTVLQIVRLSASFRNTLFVLSYDHGQISRQLRKLGVSPDFLDKIVQYPIDVPAPDKNEIDRFLIYSDVDGRKSHLDNLLDKLEIAGDPRKEFDRKSVELYAKTLSPFFPTLRNAKRFLIGFTVRLAAVKDEVCLLDFFLLEVLRVFANAVYSDISANPYYYIPPWSTKAMISSPFGLEFDERQKERRREQIRGHIEGLLRSKDHEDKILAILKELFPARIADAFGRSANYGDNAAAKFRSEKRLTHPDCFDKYFLLAVPTGTVSDAAVEATLAAWSKAEDQDKTILRDLATLSESHKLVEILGRVVMFLNKVDSELVNPLLRSISRNIQSVPPDADRTEQDAQFKLILFLLNERVPIAEKQSSTEAVLREIGSIDVAVRIVNALSSDQSAVTWELRRSLDVPRVQKLVQERFKEEFVEGGADVFEINNLPQYVLYQVGTYNSESAQMINDYALILLNKKPKYIGKLIDAFLIEYPGGPHTFQFDQLKNVYDTKGLAELVRRAGETAWSSDKEKRAIETFLRLAGETGQALD